MVAGFNDLGNGWQKKISSTQIDYLNRDRWLGAAVNIRENTFKMRFQDSGGDLYEILLTTKEATKRQVIRNLMEIKDVYPEPEPLRKVDKFVRDVLAELKRLDPSIKSVVEKLEKADYYGKTAASRVASSRKRAEASCGRE